MKLKITEERITIIFLAAIITMFSTVAIHNTFFEEAQATGCPVDTIIPFLQDAKSSLDKGDIETAKSQLEEGINQVKDTFEIKDE